MTEQMIVEAVKAAGGAQPSAAGAAVAPAQAAADPSAVSRFEAAMAANAPQAVSSAGYVPFASEMSAAWRGAQANNQGLLRRIRALSELGKMHGPSMSEMIELQYDVMNLAFQQEVVTKVADKSSNAIQTLIKNQ